MKLRMHSRLAVGLLAAGLVASACGLGSDDEASGDWELKIAVAGDIPDIDPQASAALWTRLVHYGNVSETLVQTADDGSLVPGLAKSWSAVDEDTWKFDLVDGVKFHNGEDFDAEDAAYSVTRQASEKLSAQHRGMFSAFDRAEVQDKSTLLIHTKGPAPEFPAVLALSPMVPQELAESGAALGKENIGTGPYKFDSMTTDQVVLVRNEDYRAEAAGPNRVVLESRPEAASRVAALQSGEVSIALDLPMESVDSVPRYQTAGGTQKVMLVLNAMRAPFDNPKVREAFVKAIDVEGIRTGIRPEPFSRPGDCQLVADGIFGYTAGLKPPAYDAQEAKQILADAGGAEKIEFIIPQGRYAGADEGSQVVVQQAAEAGFDVKLEPLPLETWNKRIAEPFSSKPHVYLIGATSDSGSVAQPYGVYLNETSPVQAFPFGEYPNLAADIAKAKGTIEDAQRAKAYDAVNRTVCDSNSFVFMYTTNLSNGTSKDVSFPKRLDQNLRYTTVERSGS